MLSPLWPSAVAGPCTLSCLRPLRTLGSELFSPARFRLFSPPCSLRAVASSLPPSPRAHLYSVCCYLCVSGGLSPEYQCSREGNVSQVSSHTRSCSFCLLFKLQLAAFDTFNYQSAGSPSGIPAANLIYNAEIKNENRHLHSALVRIMCKARATPLVKDVGYEGQLEPLRLQQNLTRLQDLCVLEHPFLF